MNSNSEKKELSRLRMTKHRYLKKYVETRENELANMQIMKGN